LFPIILFISLNLLFKTSGFIYVIFLTFYVIYPDDGHDRWTKHVAEYAVYNVINVRIYTCPCWFFVRNFPENLVSWNFIACSFNDTHFEYLFSTAVLLLRST